jgi:aminotransferase in exopolysaccharide biosynthesis
MSLSKEIINAIHNAIGKQSAVLNEPRFSGNEPKYVQECIDSTFVSSIGKFVNRFEADLSDYTGAKYAVAVVNGTAALHVSLLIAGVEPGDEVLVPALTFVATANAVRYCGAEPHFVDCEEPTLGMDPGALRTYLKASTEQRSGVCINPDTGRSIRAMVPVHIFGHPCDLEGLSAVAKDYNITLIEDATESFGSTYQGKHTGTFGLLGALSFNGNKTITTGGGGAILTDDLELAKHAKHLTTTAKLPHRWEYQHDEVGFNYRMPNVNAALGCAQLEQLPEILASKRRLFGRYQEAFQSISQIRLFSEPDGSHSNYWLQTLLLEESAANQRDIILEASNNVGLKTRPVWNLLHKLTPYRICPSASLPVAKSLERRIINLPSSAGLV